jgi:hypothetical protein
MIFDLNSIRVRVEGPPSEDNSGGTDPIMKGAAVDQFMYRRNNRVQVASKMLF